MTDVRPPHGPAARSAGEARSTQPGRSRGSLGPSLRRVQPALTLQRQVSRSAARVQHIPKGRHVVVLQPRGPYPLNTWAVLWEGELLA